MTTGDSNRVLRGVQELVDRVIGDGPAAKASLTSLEVRAAHSAAIQLSVSLDHFSAVEEQLRSRVGVWAPFSLLRLAAEPAARAMWLCAVDAAPDEARASRERRALSIRFAHASRNLRHCEEQVELVAEHGAADEATRAAARRVRRRAADDVSVIVQDAAASSLLVRLKSGRDCPRDQVERVDPADVAWVGEKMPRDSDFVSLAAGELGTHWRLKYAEWSMAVHAIALHAPLAASDHDGPAMQVTADKDALDTGRFVVASLLVQATSHLAQVTGYCHHDVLLAHRRQEHWEGRAPHAGWPPKMAVRERSVEVDEPCLCCGDRLKVAVRESGREDFAWCRRCPHLDRSRYLVYLARTGQDDPFTRAPRSSS